MGSLQTISAAEVIRLLQRPDSKLKCIDVRSPGEFAEGALPFFANLPILNNEERHLVGTCYKQQGPEAAVELGHKLVMAERQSRISGWKEYLAGSPTPIVACWRGGLRSKIACEWIAEAGGQALRVEGGYKEIRRQLLAQLEKLPKLLVIAGATGAKKSELLRSLDVPALDIEKHARHRGSAFGGFLDDPQPPQATFENELCLSLAAQDHPLLVAEDESQVIGQVHLPGALKEAILTSPIVVVNVPVEERAGNILQEYVVEALASGIEPAVLQARYLESLRKIQKKLGGLLTQEIEGKMQLAFRASKNLDLHREWIRDLLVHYYDGAYAFGLKRAARPVAFSGDWKECKAWIQKQFA